MAFDDLITRWRKSGHYPRSVSSRFMDLEIQSRVLDNTVFNCLKHPFTKEYDGQPSPHNYIPLEERRPALIFNIAKVVVEQSASLVFGEAHAPSVHLISESLDEEQPSADTLQSRIHKLFERVIEEADLDAKMLSAMIKGSVGSVALVLRRLPDGLPWIEVLESKFCRPFFNQEDPRLLDSLEYVYSLSAEDLRLAGYTGEYDDREMYWLRVLYTPQFELRSLPMGQRRFERLGEKDDDERSIISWEKDGERSRENPFGWMNVLWIRNLEAGRQIDGPSTFRDICDYIIAISYHLSQVGRGYHYTADPWLLIKRGEMANTLPLAGFNDFEEQSTSTPVDRSPASALVIEAGGDAKMLEISGQGLLGTDQHIRLLREFAMEMISGMKSDQQHTNHAQSGKALEYLHQALMWLVERFRHSYGKNGFLPMLRMVLRGVVEGVLEIPGVQPDDIDLTQPLRLVWPKWLAPTGVDLQATIAAIQMARGGSVQNPYQLLSSETSTQLAAGAFGISDTNRAVAQLAEEVNEKGTDSFSDLASAKVHGIVTSASVLERKAQQDGERD